MRILFLLGAACALAAVFVLLLGANELTGYVVLVLMAPVALAGPFLTAGYLFTDHQWLRMSHYAILCLMVAGNLALLTTGTWSFALTACWDCEWPFTVSKLLLVSTPLVVLGPLAIGRTRRWREERRQRRG